MEQKNTFLAIALSLMVLLGYYAFVASRTPPPEATPPTPTETPAVAADNTSLPLKLRPAESPPPKGIPRSQLLVAETPRYRAEFNLQGGTLHSFVLKNYRIDKRSTAWDDLLPPLRNWLSSKQVDEISLVDMVDSRYPTQAAFGVLLNSDNTALKELRYRTNQRSIQLQPGDAPRSINLRTRTANGMEIVKTFILDPHSYILNYQLNIRNASSQPQQLQAFSLMGAGPPSEEAIRGIGNHSGPLWWLDDDLETEDADDLDDGLVIPSADWGGISSSYFINAALPQNGSQRFFFGGLQPPEKEPWQAFYGFELSNTLLAPGQSLEHQAKVYVGPKDPVEMRKLHPKFELAKDLTLAIIAEPMLVALRAFHGFTGNYGVSIILLTICVRVLLFPLTYMGSRSMKRMRILQPKIQAIRQKFKNNKEKINQETIQIYRKHKINPLGGCLPIVAQIPIFFALYSALLSAIELRHQPFIFWIQDLSNKDGLYILPLLMSGSMVIQQRLMPAPADPLQQKILTWMPAFFLFFMFGFPSGLVLYWFISNLLSILQQLAVEKLQKDPT